jgi:hypothetical protein
MGVGNPKYKEFDRKIRISCPERAGHPSSSAKRNAKR